MARQRFVKVTIMIIFYNVTRTQITSRNTLVRAQTSDKAADLLAKIPSKIPGSVSGSGTGTATERFVAAATIFIRIRRQPAVVKISHRVIWIEISCC